MLKLALPKGRIHERVARLLGDCGLRLSTGARAYRPTIDDDRFEAKILKAQNIPSLVGLGSHDVGFTGRDWVDETGADVVELLDLGFDPVRIVVAAPTGSDLDELLARPGVVAVSEYEQIATTWLREREADFRFVRSYGATEVFPPEDADLIIDNTASGATLRANDLAILHTILRSTTRLVANKAAMDDPRKRRTIDELLLLIQGVLDARERVLLEMNIEGARLQQLIEKLPAMKSPTVSPLYGSEDFAVRVAVRRRNVARLVPELKRLGATDILETEIRKVVP